MGSNKRIKIKRINENYITSTGGTMSIIKKGNNVKILTGKDKNKNGEIIEIDRKNYRAKVKGINMIKKHIKTTKEKKGGIVSKENFVNISNLVLVEGKKKVEIK